MPVLILRALHIITYLILTTSLVIIIPIFQRRKPRLREFKKCVEVHTAGE